MKAKEIVESGWYWIRADEYREWGIAKFGRAMSNPENPRYNAFVIKDSSQFHGCSCARIEEYDVVGPIEVPTT